MTGFNASLFEAINSAAGKSHILDSLMIFSAKYFVFLVPIFLLYWWFRKPAEREKALMALATCLAGILISFLIGAFYFHPRPFAVAGLPFTQLVRHSADSSFPSDHETVLSSLAFALIFMGEIPSGVFFLIIGVVVGFARIYCGIHFPLDVAGGVLIGLVSAAVLMPFRRRLSPLFNLAISIYQKLAK